MNSVFHLSNCHACKKVVLFVLLITLSFSLFAQNFAGKRIAVTEPKFLNGTDDTAWIPLMVQGLLTTNLQNYSKMQVIDRTNLDKVKAEQKTSESAFNDESYAIELGKLATAQYIVVATIIKTSSTYSFDCKITDTETSKAVGKSFTKAGCSLQDFESGNVVNQASKELLIGLGIPEKDLKDLVVDNSSVNTKQNSAVKSNVALAKGMAQETVNQNVVQALSYYKQALSADASMSEATSRLNSLTSAVSTGNIREDAKNEIALRKAWLKTLDDLKEFYQNNIFYFVYDTDIQSELDVANETVSLKIPCSVEINEDAEEITRQIVDGFLAVTKESWKINLYDYLDCYFYVKASILDEKQVCLGTWEHKNSTYSIEYHTSRNYNNDSITYKFLPSIDGPFNLQLDPISYKKITDTLSIKIDSIKVRPRYKDYKDAVELKAPLILTKAEYEQIKLAREAELEEQRIALEAKLKEQNEQYVQKVYDQKQGRGARTGFLGNAFVLSKDNPVLGSGCEFSLGITNWLYTGLNYRNTSDWGYMTVALGANYRLPILKLHPNVFAEAGIGFSIDGLDSEDLKDSTEMNTVYNFSLGVDIPIQVLETLSVSTEYSVVLKKDIYKTFYDCFSIGLQLSLPNVTISSLFAD